MTPLELALFAAAELVPADWRAVHAPLFSPELRTRLAQRLADLHRDGVPAIPPPHFDIECTPPLADAFVPFRDAWTPQQIADALVTAGIVDILVILGQRRTPASFVDVRGLPPPRSTLLAAGSGLVRPGNPLTVAARAWAKHAPRSADSFWGTVSGNTAAKNAAALALIVRILEGATWWNVFGHFAHESVFEARLPSGHGARWEADGTRFVGFLEPFLDPS